MENNELLAQILQEMQTTNLMNKKLMETLVEVQAENKQLSENNTHLNAHIELLKKEKTITSSTQVHNTTKIEPTLNNNSAHDVNIAIVQAEEVMKKPMKDRFNNFKTMVKTQSDKFNIKYSFSDKTSALFNNIKNKVVEKYTEDKMALNILMNHDALPSIKTAYVNMRNGFIEKAHKAGVSVQVKAHEVLINPLQNKMNNVYETLFLVGKRKTVAKLKTNFSQSLSLIGLKADDLVYDNTDKNYASVEEVSTTIDEKLAKQLKIIKVENEYIPVALQNLDDEMKLEIIKKMLWPKLMKEIESSLGLSLHLNKIKNNNVHMKSIDAFASKNDLTLETAIHCLENHDSLLETYKGVQNIIKDKDTILHTAEKFEIIGRNNFIILQSLVKAATNLEKIISNLNVDNKEETLEELSKTKVAQDGKKFFSFSTIQKNISKLLANQNFVNGVVESNIKNKFVKNNEDVTERTSIPLGMKI